MSPEDVRCTALTSESLQISWQPPPSVSSNGIIQGYKLNYEPVIAEPWQNIDEMEVCIQYSVFCLIETHLFWVLYPD